jgi:hypothetical protein
MQQLKNLINGSEVKETNITLVPIWVRIYNNDIISRYNNNNNNNNNNNSKD